MIHPKEGLQEQNPRFRETEPVALWSARLTLQIPYAEFEQAVSRIAVSNGQRYTGFITKDGDNNVTSFTRTRYPRRKYGVASIPECHEGMVVLAEELGGEIETEPARDGFRVVLGLIEGYDHDAPAHSVGEVRQALPGANVTSSEVFAIRQTDTGISVYTEPVAVIEAPTGQISNVYDIGDRFKQERFTIEDFKRGLAYIVETRFCTEPD